MSRLPEPMLARSGPLPDSPEWRFELNLDASRQAGSWCQDCLATGAYDPPEEQAAQDAAKR